MDLKCTQEERVNLKIHPILHRRLRIMAAKQGVTIFYLCAKYLRQGMAADNAKKRAPKEEAAA
jgi:predicted HicB family RNase H-like nuclease